MLGPTWNGRSKGHVLLAEAPEVSLGINGLQRKVLFLFEHYETGLAAWNWKSEHLHHARHKLINIYKMKMMK